MVSIVGSFVASPADLIPTVRCMCACKPTKLSYNTVQCTDRPATAGHSGLMHSWANYSTSVSHGTPLLSLVRLNILNNKAVASPGWVTPGAATEGVTPLFFPEKPGDLFFCSSLSISLSLFIAFTRVSTLQGVTPHFFYLSDLVSPLFFVNLPTKNFFPSGVTRVGPPPLSPVTPL